MTVWHTSIRIEFYVFLITFWPYAVGMSSLPDLSPPLGPPPRSLPAAMPEHPAQRRVSESAADWRTALPDIDRGRYRARPKHQRPAPADIRTDQEAALDRPPGAFRKAAGPPPLSNPSAGFLTQILDQAAAFTEPGGLRQDRDGPAKGSDAYRRAGGEPAVYPTSPTVFRIAV